MAKTSDPKIEPMAKLKQQVMGDSREFRVGDQKRNGEVPQGEIGQLAKGYVDTWLRGLPKRAKQQEVDVSGCDVRVTVTVSVERDAPEPEMGGEGDSDGGLMEGERSTE